MDTSSKVEPPPLAPAGGRSLRLRMMLVSAVTIAVALTIAGVALVTIFDRHLERRVAQELGVRLLELARFFQLDEDGTPAVTGQLADPRYEQPYSGSYWQVAGPNGPVLRARSLWDQELPWRDRFGLPSEAWEITGPRGGIIYVLDRDIRLTPDGEAPRVFRLAVALDHAELEDLRRSFTQDVVQSLGIIALVLILGSWVQISFGLRPLRMLQTQLGLIGSGRAARLRGRFPEEVAPLAANLNALIDQHDETVRRARVRAGDLAHGLKTPLTILTGEARRIEEAGQHASAERLREQIGAMRAHVERELARARTQGAPVAGGAFTDAPATIDRLLGLMRRMPRGEALVFSHTLPPGLRLRMDPGDFGEVMGNLLDNARRWAHGGVTVSALRKGGEVTIAVDDDGPGMPAPLRARMRARGESGAPPGEGSGLGLAIVTDVLAQYGTTLQIDDAPQGGCRVAFTLPGWTERET